MDKFEREARARPRRHQPVPSQYRTWWGHGSEVKGKGGVVWWWGEGKRSIFDPRLVAHTLNVDPEARPVAQPARIFHTEIEGQIVKVVQKLLAAGFIKPI